jgi:hypothetical protein
MLHLVRIFYKLYYGARIHEHQVFYTTLFFLWRCDPMRVMASSFLRFLDHTQRRTRVGRTPLDEWSSRRRYLYFTTHNTHNRQTSMPPVGLVITISTGERPQTFALDRATTGTGILYHSINYYINTQRGCFTQTRWNWLYFYDVSLWRMFFGQEVVFVLPT